MILDFINEGKVIVASTASGYPLAKFAVGIIPNPQIKTEVIMVNRKRNIQMKFWVTEEEKSLIDQKMKLLPTQRYGKYLRKMAIDGYIIYTDTTDIKEMNQILGAISRNINQIAKRINYSGRVYPEDMEEIKKRISEIWQIQRFVYGKLEIQ